MLTDTHAPMRGRGWKACLCCGIDLRYRLRAIPGWDGGWKRGHRKGTKGRTLRWWRQGR